MNLRNEITHILMPPEPPEAHLKGGVVNWEAQWTKDGLLFLVDRIMEKIKEDRKSDEPQLPMVEDTMTKSNLMINHGNITHPAGAKCKFCSRVKKEFNDKFSFMTTAPEWVIEWIDFRDTDRKYTATDSLKELRVIKSILHKQRQEILDRLLLVDDLKLLKKRIREERAK